MANKVKAAFERQLVVLPLSALMPLKTVADEIRKLVKYKRIARSIAEIGIVEPIVVSPSKTHRGKYLLLDGHLRQSILVEQGHSETRCLIANDDEAFTYNKRINGLATIQEHFMIVRALRRGVSEEKLARALDVDLKLIKRRRTLLDGICPEVVDMLADRKVNPSAFDVLRKMRPMRQIEAAELMVIAGNFANSYARALLAATKQSELVKSDEPKKIAGLTPEQMAKMEREMSALQQDYKSIEASYGDDILHLVIATGYLSRLIRNRHIERYLAQNHGELLKEFRAIVAATSLDQAQAAE
jgi:ParB-like chromosome segregation protein Spo0J